jgi:ribosomal protein L18
LLVALGRKNRHGETTDRYHENKTKNNRRTRVIVHDTKEGSTACLIISEIEKQIWIHASRDEQMPV